MGRYRPPSCPKRFSFIAIKLPTPPPVLCVLRASAAKRLVEIEREFDHPMWDEELFKSEFKNSHSKVFGIRTCGSLAAFLIVHAIGDEVHIINLGVAAAFQARGIGTFMVGSVLSQYFNQGVQYVTLEVRRSNNSARWLYNKFNFQEVGVRMQYYLDNREDAIVMRLDRRDFKGDVTH